MKPALLILAMTVSLSASTPAEKITTHTDVITEDGRVEYWRWETRGKRLTVTIRDAKGDVLRVFVFSLELPTPVHP